MTSAVSRREGVNYGLRLISYSLGILVAGFGSILLAVRLFQVPGSIGIVYRIGGLIFGFVGVLVIYAGSLGLVHKVIADGVKKGIEEADDSADQD
jgi:hypothetical protein